MDLVRQFFLARPNQDISHEESKKYLENEWLKLTGKRFEDSDRAIRHLKDIGLLIKVGKGIYRYDPSVAKKNDQHDFDAKTKNAILKRDNFKCVVCGLGQESGQELHVDHVRPKSLGGLNNLENGQTLCSSHNFLKKNFSQLEMGKRLFLRIDQDIRSGKVNAPNEFKSFIEEILSIYDKYRIDTKFSEKYFHE